MKIDEILSDTPEPIDLSHTIELEEPVLYRAETIRTRYPSGTFWTLDPKIATLYSTKTRRAAPRRIQVYAPHKLHLFDVDAVANSEEIKLDVQLSYIEWADRLELSSEDREQMYMWDVLWGNQSDFVYPTQQDMDFVVDHMGLDGVYYSMEGGELVQSIFLAGPLPQDTQYVDHILADPYHALHNFVQDFTK